MTLKLNGILADGGEILSISTDDSSDPVWLTSTANCSLSCPEQTNWMVKNYDVITTNIETYIPFNKTTPKMKNSRLKKLNEHIFPEFG